MNNDDSASSATPSDNTNDALNVAPAPPPKRKRPIVQDNLIFDNSVTPEDKPQTEEDTHIQHSSQPDWDSISSTAPANSTTDSWDSVSTPQPRGRSGGQSKKISLSRRIVFLGLAGLVLAGLVIASLASGGTWFVIFSGTHRDNSVSTTAAATEAATTTSTNATATATAFTNATATAQAVATATTAQKIYTQATSGTPVVDDPLSSDNGNLGLSSDNQDTCAFTGGAYHITLPTPLALRCSVNKGNFNNFALQVQVDIVKGGDEFDEGGVYFGDVSNHHYKILINSKGDYSLYLWDNGQYTNTTLKTGFSSAIVTGLNQANVMTVIMNDGTFYLYVNNKSVGDSDNLSGYSQGVIGLVANNLDQATDVAFSNLKVWTF